MRIRQNRAAQAIVAATTLLLTMGLAAPATAAASEPEWPDGVTPATVTTLWGAEREVTGAELAEIIASPGVYTHYHVYLDRLETEWTALGWGIFMWFGVQDAPEELQQSFIAAGPSLKAFAETANLWGGCIKTATPLSNPTRPATVSVHAGKYCS